MRYWKFVVVIFYLSAQQVLAQDNFSESFFSFASNMQLHMPSIACAGNDIEGNLAYRSYTGKLSIIRSYYADVNLNLRKKKLSTPEHSKHVLGVGFYNDREGEYFTKARILSRYAVHVPLNDHVFLSGGASFHLINYNFNASGSGAAGSGWTWSSGISTTLYSSRFKLGISWNDLNSPTIRPIQYDFSIPRYFTGYGEKRHSLTSTLVIKGAGKCNWKPGSVRGLLQLGLVFSEAVALSALYYPQKGAGVIFDLSQLKVQNGHADFSLAYLIPSVNAAPAATQYELNFRFYMDR